MKNNLFSLKNMFAMSALFVATGCAHAPPPEGVTIDVPFTPQAPEGNWSEPWQNACEETSIYMVSSFYQNDEMKREEAVQKIKEIFEVKHEEFQVSADESMETISRLIEELKLPFTTEIVYDPTGEDLKKELAEQRPIIVPVYAPELGFLEGVDYHVLVLVGYDDETQEFIVNDPGSSSGDEARFSYETFMEAIHDLNKENYTAGRKAVLFTKERGVF